MPDNVRVNLEVRAQPIPLVGFFDDDPNYRGDGSRQGIYTIQPINQIHSNIHHRYGAGMNWVGAQLAALGFLGEGEPVPSSRSIRRRVPAPPGFEYYDAP